MKKPRNLDEFLYVRVSNLLTRSAHGLSLPEKRILMTGISKLHKTPFSTANPVVRIHASELASVGKISIDQSYSDAREGQKKLYERSISLLFDPVTGEEKPGFTRWITRAHYQDDEAWIELVFNHELVPYLFELEKEFTSYKLSRAGSFRSIYTWRLFELLMQFKRTGLLRITVNDFHKLMETEAAYKKNFYHLRVRVIEPAVAEINRKDSLSLTWEPIKKGRRVESLEFKFPVEQQKKLPLNKKKNSASLPEQKKSESVADLIHLKKLAELAEVPLETLLPNDLKEELEQL